MRSPNSAEDRDGAGRLAQVLAEARACRVCAAALPHAPRPVLRAQVTARILLVGQAPGTRVHESGLPFDDRSGDRLRVEVCDGVSVPPVLRPQQPAGAPPSERGRGLFLVASLADRWGWEDHESGKAVWFELEVG